MDKSPILKVNNLTTSYYNNGKLMPIVRDVSFELYKGEILALVGESGCGKSVTSMSIMQLIPSTSGKITDGKIEFQGNNLIGLSKKQLKNIRGKEISMVFQDPMTCLNPVFTVGNQMIETVLAHERVSKEEARLRARHYLEITRLPDPDRIMKSYPFELSGGMRQRIMIAIALICKPKVIIADEPTTALDPTVQAQILDLFIEFKEKYGTAIIFITHDLGVVANCADRVAVMYAGNIIEYGTKNQVLNHSANPYTRALISSIPRMEEGNNRLTTIEGMPPDLKALPEGCTFEPRCTNRCDICAKKAPEMFDLGSGHMSRCWLVKGNQ